MEKRADHLDDIQQPVSPAKYTNSNQYFAASLLNRNSQEWSDIWKVQKMEIRSALLDFLVIIWGC